MTQIACDQLTRKERLRIWMMRNGLTFLGIARQLGETRHSVTAWLTIRDTIPVRRRKQLERFGIPEDLLPPGLDRHPGPVRRVGVLALPPAASDAHIPGDSTVGVL